MKDAIDGTAQLSGKQKARLWRGLGRQEGVAGNLRMVKKD